MFSLLWFLLFCKRKKNHSDMNGYLLSTWTKTDTCWICKWEWILVKYVDENRNKFLVLRWDGKWNWHQPYLNVIIILNILICIGGKI